MLRSSIIALFVVLAAASACTLAARAQIVTGTDPLIRPDAENFPSDPSGAIARARELIAQGKAEQAIVSLRLYVNVHPDEVAPKRFLGDLYFRTGQIEHAKFIYQQLLVVNPYDKETHNRLGTVYSVENDIEDAIVQYNAALPGTDSVDDLVAVHMRKGDLNAYRDAVARAAKQFPTDSGIQVEAGQVYNALRQPYLATSYFHRAIDDDPKNAAAYNGLGISYLNMNDFTQADVAFGTCLRVDPLSYECTNNLGALQLESGKFDDAQKTLDEAFHLAPERAETFVNFGYLADAQGDWQKAAADDAKAIALFPYLEEAYVDLGLIYEQHGKLALAQAILIKGLASVRDDGRLHDLLGDAYLAQGDRADALRQYAQAMVGTDPLAASLAREHVATLGAPSPQPTQ
jgi:superkiller protein 3